MNTVIDGFSMSMSLPQALVKQYAATDKQKALEVRSAAKVSSDNVNVHNNTLPSALFNT